MLLAGMWIMSADGYGDIFRLFAFLMNAKWKPLTFSNYSVREKQSEAMQGYDYVHISISLF